MEGQLSVDNAKVVNVVATAELDQYVNLARLAKSGQAVYDKSLYGGRAGYIRSPSSAGEVILFQSGKMISVGANSEELAYALLEQVRDLLVEHGYIEFVRLKPRTRNIVLTFDFRRRLDLERLPLIFDMEFEPEQFPAAIMRLE